MKCLVLGINYLPEEHETTRLEWIQYGIEFDFAADLCEALVKLMRIEYICISFCSNFVPHDDIAALRRVRAIPIVVLPVEYNAAQRYECVQRGVEQYINAVRQRRAADLSGKDNMRFIGYLEGLYLPNEQLHSQAIGGYVSVGCNSRRHSVGTDSAVKKVKRAV